MVNDKWVFPIFFHTSFYEFEILIHNINLTAERNNFLQSKHKKTNTVLAKVSKNNHFIYRSHMFAESSLPTVYPRGTPHGIQS